MSSARYRDVANCHQRSGSIDRTMASNSNEVLPTGSGVVIEPQASNVVDRPTSLSATPGTEGQSTTGVVSYDRIKPKPHMKINFDIGDNLSGEPRWVVTKQNPIFEDEKSKREAVGASGAAFRGASSFFDYPVRYTAEDATGHSDSYRTVMIDGIPIGSTMKDVLTITKVGEVESIQLFPPIGRATSSMTARVVFINESSAHYLMRTQEGRGPFTLDGVMVRCWMPTDPTYPRNPQVEAEIFGNSPASRTIAIAGVDEYLYNQIPHKLKKIHPRCDKYVIGYNSVADDRVTIEFTDIKIAIAARKVLETDWELRCMGANVEYCKEQTVAPCL
jgi:hypothetical protein